MKSYKYGMRARGFSLGCQPNDFTKWQDSDKSKTGYWSYIWYDRQLSESEIQHYQLDEIEINE